MKKFNQLEEVIIGKPSYSPTTQYSDVIIDETDHFAFKCRACNSSMKINAVHHYPQQQQVSPFQSPCTKFFLECESGHIDTMKTYWDGVCDEAMKTQYVD